MEEPGVLPGIQGNVAELEQAGNHELKSQFLQAL